MRGTAHTTAWRLACAVSALALAVALGGCSAGSTTSSSSGPIGEVAAPAPSTGAAGSSAIRNDGTAQGALEYGAPGASTDSAKTVAGVSASTAVQKLIVVNKTMRIETTDVQASLTKIRALTAKTGGDITSMQVSTSSDQPVYPIAADGVTTDQSGSSVPLQAYVTVRVPSSGYAAFIAESAKLGRVLYQSESSDDVTQQHVDMTARLVNLKAEQARLRQLFAKAKNVADMLAIEQELTRVQGDIESMQAQVTYLERQAAMATVTLELTEPTPIVSPAGTDWGITAAMTDAVRAFVNTLNVIIVLVGPALAILIFVGVPVWLVVWLVRRSMRRRRAAKAARAKTAELPVDATESDR
jgi:hypothetical protein